MYAIRHKNSGEIISSFPSLTKRFSIYGFVVLTYDLRIQFYYSNNDEEHFEDITDEYEIINQNNTDETQIQNTKNT